MRFFHSGWLWNPAQTVTHQHPPLGLAWAWAGLGPTSALDFTAALSPHCGLVTVITAFSPSLWPCRLTVALSLSLRHLTITVALSSHCGLVTVITASHHHCGLVTVIMALSSHCDLVVSLWPCHLTVALLPSLWPCRLTVTLSSHCGLVILL